MNEETPKQLNSTFASHISIANIPSFGVDVQYESLKSYLDSISVIIYTSLNNKGYR
jgi:hypothetical protein